MKKAFILLSIVLTVGTVFGQSKSELRDQINQLRAQIVVLENKVAQLESQIQTLQSDNNELKIKSTTPVEISKQVSETASQSQTNLKKEEPTKQKQCKATTKNGTQCTRQAKEGDDYCWQHGKSESSSVTKSSVKSSSSAGSGRTIHTGPRGGKYYINSKGKKVYVK